ncbi:MAG: rRNA maturation RNase YbeY [Luminiphilus sp.]|jgi:probable rRNA maturation factor|nr:rRNA maturation RNase YbeY [Luminiphilus sp.]MDG1461618.1 rRNA maturation RNase YbeY [Luminiphilus sp.]
MTPVLHIERDDSIEAPDDESFERWVNATCRALNTDSTAQPELSIRISNTDEMSQLNLRFRHRSGPTNVLSFPAEIPDDIGCELLGDIVICSPLVWQEAQEQGKTPTCHWAHLTVHGVLHLLGYDHDSDDTAQDMEALETQILQQFGCPDPYISASEAQRVELS